MNASREGVRGPWQLRAWAWSIGLMAVTSGGCSAPVEELPAVWTPPGATGPCVEPARAIVPLAPRARERPDISSCVELAWASQCEGRMSFEADVDPSGRVSALRFGGDASPELRSCIQKVLRGALVLNPAECPGTTEAATIGGGISWPRDGGTYVRLAGETAIIPCIRQCDGPKRARTPGCG